MFTKAKLRGYKISSRIHRGRDTAGKIKNQVTVLAFLWINFILISEDRFFAGEYYPHSIEETFESFLHTVGLERS